MNGIIPLWKERGMTSHDAVFKLRKILHTKKVGHTGTLDPEVSGVLPICVGRATKLAEYMTDEGKEYIAEISIGKSTTTEDGTGDTVSTKEISHAIDKEQITEVLVSLTGEITQIPPMYSAVKVNGKKLYEYARLGQTIDRPQRQVQIHALERLDDKALLTAAEPTFRLRIACGKGTYIRTLAVMIGEKLGYPAHMSKLERTKSGFFQKKDCFTLQEIAEKVVASDWSFLAPLEKGIASFAQIDIEDAIYKQALNGRVFTEEELNTSVKERLALMHNERLVAIYKPHPEKEKMYKPEKVIELNDAK
ncbi:tRNA pseudouridine(55) synthase TruB [Listeria sp. PSOL-1]|uniref:tRNA pseudouridine(55) synthase TruB n=1 Tax=Listeria sp. PSOL-1 TaxID=1844999 RepID=UPI0013D73B70|nr:tRNA pseudouridine(55) synthase TruB [Listeria sp. PSOL-1]